jgi:antitoxin VapB
LESFVAIHLREPETDLAVRKLAARLGVSLTEAIRISATNELARTDLRNKPLAARLRNIQDQIAAYKPTGQKADKAFFDELSGDL